MREDVSPIPPLLDRDMFTGRGVVDPRAGRDTPTAPLPEEQVERVAGDPLMGEKVPVLHLILQVP